MFGGMDQNKNSRNAEAPLDLTNVEAPPDEGSDYGEGRAFDRGAALSKLKLTRGNIVLIGLFAAGIASVYFLSIRKGPDTASASDTTVEQQVEDFISGNGAAGATAKKGEDETQKVVDSLYHYAARHQVPLKDLKANPFTFTSAEKPKAAPVKTSTGPTPEQLAAGKKKAEVDAEYAQLQLQSIMMGQRGGTAIINGNFLTEGQYVGSLKVSKIMPRSVELTWNSEVFTLRIAE